MTRSASFQFEREDSNEDEGCWEQEVFFSSKGKDSRQLHVNKERKKRKHASGLKSGVGIGQKTGKKERRDLMMKVISSRE